MTVPEYIEDLDKGDEIRGKMNLAFHRALFSLHKWEQGHDGDYCIHGQGLWWFDGTSPGANRNDTPGGNDSENNGSWKPIGATVTIALLLQLLEDAFNAKENAWGNPQESGQVASSNVNGTRTWITIPSGTGGGTDGKSAYQIWIDAGNTGNEQDFLDSLVGAGQSAYQAWIALGNTGTEQEFLDSLQGNDGADGVVDQSVLDGLNQAITDAKDRDNHAGTQDLSTISDAGGLAGQTAEYRSETDFNALTQTQKDAAEIVHMVECPVQAEWYGNQTQYDALDASIKNDDSIKKHIEV